MQISKIKKILNRCACSKKLEFFHSWLRSSCAILSSPSFCSTEWPLMLLFLLNGMLVYYKMLSYSFFKFLCQFSGTIYLFYFMKPIQVVFWIVQYSRENFVHIWRATVSGKDPQGVGLRICSISTMKVGYQMLYILCIQDIVGGQVHEFQVHRPFETPRSYQLKIGDEAIEAPMVCG